MAKRFLAGPAALLCGACAPVDVPIEAPAPPRPGSFRALGQEPGWTLTIADGEIDYRGNYGEKRIRVPAPEPRTTFNGHRYETPRLIVDLTHGRCNDVMSGHGYSEQVMVIADGETYRGCGGDRRPDWDL
jgi:uncharacterized membrane protein